jgi:hypothetical protein|tara:strand:- start:584 stop:1021 length:438 start_codon:yes stop_codon:yes gene_type:complete
MLFKIIGSKRKVNRDLREHTIDWDTKVKRGGKKNFGKLQYDVKQLLRPHWELHVVNEEFVIPATRSERGRSIDFINFTTRTCVEVDGIQHNKKSWCHKNKYQFFKQLRNDSWKEQWAELNGFNMFRIYETDELNDELLYKLGIIS